jgi:hypothetical protein
MFHSLAVESLSRPRPGFTTGRPDEPPFDSPNLTLDLSYEDVDGDTYEKRFDAGFSTLSATISTSPFAD